MISSRKRQLVIILILFCICVPVLGVEPNEPETELKFEISATVRQWEFSGPIKPKYVAVFSMSDLSRLYEPVLGLQDMETAKMILTTSAGQSMSEIQKELLKAYKVISQISTKKVRKKYTMVSHTARETEFGLFAFNIEDAKLVTEAFIETMNKKARGKLPPLLEEFMNNRKQGLREYREGIADIKKKLAEMEPQLKPAESAYKKFKDTDRYRILADTDADEKTRKNIAQISEMLSIIDIELAGIREKLAVIEKYRESDQFSKATLEKLEQMFVEQMVELRGAEGRKKATIKLLEQDKKFCDLYDAWTGLELKVSVLRDDLKSREKRVRFFEEEMANPPDELLPPKVLGNKVTIYPVLVED